MQRGHLRTDRPKPSVVLTRGDSRRDFTNEHQSQRNVWREYMYCVIKVLMTSHCLRWKWSPTMITSVLICGII